MGVGDASDFVKSLVKDEVRGEIGGRTKSSIDDFAFEIDDDDVFGLHGVVRNAAGLDGDKSLGAIDAAGVAEGIKDEATTHQLKVGGEDFFAKGFQEHRAITGFDRKAAGLRPALQQPPKMIMGCLGWRQRCGEEWEARGLR